MTAEMITVDNVCRYCGCEIKLSRRFCSAGHAARWRIENGWQAGRPAGVKNRPKDPPAAPATIDPAWRKRALCRGLDGLNGQPDFLAAPLSVQRKICKHCPVRFECLTDANATELHPQDRLEGVIRGGLTGPERYRLRQS